MVDTELLIFSLISLIILIPIIYFLPLNLTKQGKMTVIAVSFLIALAGLLTKVFMQLWQSVLLLVGLILLLSMLLTKKYSPVLFTVSDGSSKGMDSDKHEKDKETSNFSKLESLPEIPENGTNINSSFMNEYLEPEILENGTNMSLDDEGYRGDELEELHAVEPNEHKENEFIYPSEDALYSPSLEAASTIEEEEVPSVSYMELEEMEEIEPISLEKQPQAENEEIPVISGASSYLSELEELMLESQAESAAAAELLTASVTETVSILDAEEVVHSDDGVDIEAMFNNQLIEETEWAKEPSEETADEEEMVQINMEEYPALNEFSNEDVQAVFNEEMETQETITEEPVVETEPSDTIENVQTAINEEERDLILPIHENSNDEMEHNIVLSEEQWDQMETPEAIQEAVQEIEVLPEEQPVYPQETSKTLERKEVFETLLLQAEIAKKMQDKEQFEQIVENFLNYDDSDDERYKMLKILLKDYINIIK